MLVDPRQMKRTTLLSPKGSPHCSGNYVKTSTRAVQQHRSSSPHLLPSRAKSDHASGGFGRVVTGITPSSRHPDHFGAYLPFITPSDMDGRRRIEFPERWLSEQGAAALRSRIVERAVAVSCIGWQMGKSVLIDKPSVTNQQLNSIVVHEEKADSCSFTTRCWRRERIFFGADRGITTPILNKRDFEQLELYVPDLPVQRAVGRLLGLLDDKIELNRQANRKIETLVNELFRSWFVDFDPVVAKRDWQETNRRSERGARSLPEPF